VGKEKKIIMAVITQRNSPSNGCFSPRERTPNPGREWDLLGKKKGQGKGRKKERGRGEQGLKAKSILSNLHPREMEMEGSEKYSIERRRKKKKKERGKKTRRHKNPIYLPSSDFFGEGRKMGEGSGKRACFEKGRRGGGRRRGGEGTAYRCYLTTPNTLTSTDSHRKEKRGKKGRGAKGEGCSEGKGKGKKKRLDDDLFQFGRPKDTGDMRKKKEGGGNLILGGKRKGEKKGREKKGFDGLVLIFLPICIFLIGDPFDGGGGGRGKGEVKEESAMKQGLA